MWKRDVCKRLNIRYKVLSSKSKFKEKKLSDAITAAADEQVHRKVWAFAVAAADDDGARGWRFHLSFSYFFLLINTLSCVKLPKLIHRLTSAAAAAANSRSRRLTTLLPPPLQHFHLSSLNCSQISSNALTSSFFLPQIALKDLISDH